MQKLRLSAVIAVALFLAATVYGCGDRQPSSTVSSRGPGGRRNSDPMGFGPMMSGRCPMCQGPWQGGRVDIPDKLPKPKSKQWISRLNVVLSLERLSLAQYDADEKKYKVHMPYAFIIPQENDHIEWIGKLFKAYGVKSDAKTLTVTKSTSVRQAYEIGRDLESQLIPKYVWLMQQSEDSTTKKVLNSVLLQTRTHHMMFTHALSMSERGMWH